MTIKDILVGLAVRDEADPARDYAFAMASDTSDIQVFTAEEGSKGSDFRGSSLVRRLRLHGLVAGLAERHEADVAQAIVREVEAFRASLVVMGGYGHSRS